MTGLNAELFSSEAIPPEVSAFNEAIGARMAKMPGLWDVGIAEARKGFMPSPPPAPQSYDLPIGDDLSLHIVPAAQPKGVLLHIHGGGFILGGAAKQDPVLERIAAASGLTCASVEYHLAPEHPYPAAWDDCERAALWLIDNAAQAFGAGKLVVMGESAGALLAVATLVRLRDRGISRFCGAALNFGVYDSGMTPSQVRAQTGVLKARDIARIVDAYAPDPGCRRDPDVSPLYADLHGLPPALFTVGTLDAMLDDSLFMYARWLAAQGRAELALYPGADHAFVETPHPQAGPANARIDDFLARCVDE